MTNREKFAKEIIELAIQGKKFAVSKNTNKIKECETTYCGNCLFGDYQYCPDGRRKWANAEYKEPKRFTEREKAFIKLFPEIQYIARDKWGKLFAYRQKPSKGEVGNCWDCDYDPDIVFEINFEDIFKFESIQCDDEEPTSREEILKE